MLLPAVLLVLAVGLPGAARAATPAEAAAERPAWPDAVHVDTGAGVVAIRWRPDDADWDLRPLARVARFERAHPWEGRPDELIVVFDDGDRVLACTGEEVGSQAILAPALSGRPFVDLPPGEGHLVPAGLSAVPGPDFAVGALDEGFALTAAAPGGGAGPGEPGRPIVVVPDDATEAAGFPPPPDLSGDGGGTLPRSAIERVIREAQAAGFRRCYARGLQRNPNLGGKLDVGFVIEPDGRVERAWVERSTLGDPEVARCVLDLLAQQRFRAPEGGSVIVHYPLRFSAD